MSVSVGGWVTRGADFENTMMLGEETPDGYTGTMSTMNQ